MRQFLSIPLSLFTGWVLSNILSVRLNPTFTPNDDQGSPQQPPAPISTPSQPLPVDQAFLTTLRGLACNTERNGQEVTLTRCECGQCSGFSVIFRDDDMTGSTSLLAEGLLAMLTFNAHQAKVARAGMASEMQEMFWSAKS